MNKITTGIIAGTVASTIGMYAMSDRKTRKMIAKNSKKMLKKTKNLIDKVDIF